MICSVALYKQTSRRRITAAGTVPDSHRIPFHQAASATRLPLFNRKDTNKLAKIQIYLSFLMLKCHSGLTHLLQQRLLTIGEIRRQLYLIGDDEVAEGTVTPIVTLTTKTDLGTGLRFGLDLHLHL